MIKDKICYFNNKQDKIEIKNQKIYINETITKMIGKGVDGEVYRYNDLAIKLYHDDTKIKEHLTKEQINYLSSLLTKHIILPKESLIGNNNPGFTMNYIDLNTKKDILLTDKNELINQVKTLEQELELIGKNHFLLDDFNPNNLYYNGNIYLFDPDSFVYDGKVDFSIQNINVFVWYFIKNIIFNLDDELTKQQQLSLIRKLIYLYRKNNNKSLSDFLENIITQDNLKQTRSHYIKHLKK